MLGMLQAAHYLSCYRDTSRSMRAFVTMLSLRELPLSPHKHTIEDKATSGSRFPNNILSSSVIDQKKPRMIVGDDLGSPIDALSGT